MSEMSVVFLIIWGVIILALALAGLALLGVWVYRDARSQGITAWPWVLITVLVTPHFIGLILYWFVGRGHKSARCPQCGYNIPSGSRFCPYCGAAYDPIEPGQMPNSPLPPVRRESKSMLVCGYAAIVVSMLMAVALFVTVAVANFGGSVAMTSSETSMTLGDVNIATVQGNFGNTWQESFGLLSVSHRTHTFSVEDDGQQHYLVYNTDIKSGSFSITMYPKGDESDSTNIPLGSGRIAIQPGSPIVVSIKAGNASGSFSFKVK